MPSITFLERLQAAVASQTGYPQWDFEDLRDDVQKASQTGQPQPTSDVNDKVQVDGEGSHKYTEAAQSEDQDVGTKRKRSIADEEE